MENKEEVIKSIRFSKEELYLLECCKNKKFSTFIKELLLEYAENKNKVSTNNIDIEKIKEEIKVELFQELKTELLKELKVEVVPVTKEEVEEETKVDDTTKKALFNLLGR